MGDQGLACAAQQSTAQQSAAWHSTRHSTLAQLRTRRPPATCRGCCVGRLCALAASTASAQPSFTPHAPLHLLARTYLLFRTAQHTAATPPLCAQQCQPGYIGAGTPAGLATDQTAHCALLQLLCSWPARGALHVLTHGLYGPAALAASVCAPAGHTTTSGSPERPWQGANEPCMAQLCQGPCCASHNRFCNATAAQAYPLYLHKPGEASAKDAFDVCCCPGAAAWYLYRTPSRWCCCL